MTCSIFIFINNWKISIYYIIPDLEEKILLYMETMVELDRWILCLPQDDSMLGSNDQESDDVEPMNVDISDNLPSLD